MCLTRMYSRSQVGRPQATSMEGCCFGFEFDLAVRKESAPTSVAMDFLTNGFGTWDYVYGP